MATEMSTILVIGGTGYIGKHVVRASVKQGHRTFVYMRPIITPQTSLSKLLLHKEFLADGVNVFQGQLDEHEKLVEAVSRADIVIATLAFPQILDQLKIIQATKVAGNVKVGIQFTSTHPLIVQTRLIHRKGCDLTVIVLVE
ncbi:unnamed protein product [Rhodiola kirilowii]